MRVSLSLWHIGAANQDGAHEQVTDSHGQALAETDFLAVHEAEKVDQPRRTRSWLLA
jgi:hypothetical protein